MAALDVTIFDNRTGTYRNGNVHTVTDPKLQAVESFYDRANRVVQTTHRRADNSIEETRGFTYDKVGNVLTVSDAAGDTTYTYDALYRVKTETRDDTGEVPYTVTSAYDLAGNRISVNYNASRILGSVYDAMNRLVEVDDAGRESVYAYDKNGNRLSLTYPNGVINAYAYDALNRVAAAETRDGTGTVLYAIGDVDVDAEDKHFASVQGYMYDLVGNRLFIDEQSLQADNGLVTRNLSYEYDARYQLTLESWAGELYTYDYDRAGNRVGMEKNGTLTSYTYNVRNEIDRWFLFRGQLPSIRWLVQKQKAPAGLDPRGNSLSIPAAHHKGQKPSPQRTPRTQRTADRGRTSTAFTAKKAKNAKAGLPRWTADVGERRVRIGQSRRGFSRVPGFPGSRDINRFRAGKDADVPP